MRKELQALGKRQLTWTMVFVVLVVLLVCLLSMAWMAYHNEKALLEREALSYKAFIEESFRAQQASNADVAMALTVRQTLLSQRRLQRNDSHRFYLLERRGDQIHLLGVGSSYAQTKEIILPANGVDKTIYIQSIGLVDAQAQGVTLPKNSATAIGYDYRQVLVLAAYTTIPLGQNVFALVNQIDLGELLAEIWQRLLLVALFAAGLSYLGCKRFLRFITPMIQTLEQDVIANQSMIATSPTAIVVTNKDGLVMDFNPAAERLFGFHSAEIVGNNVRRLLPAEVVAQHADFFVRHQENNAPQNIGIEQEIEALHKDGHRIPIHLAVNIIQLDNEIRFIGMVHDITARKASEAELLQHRDHLAELVDSATAEVFAIVQTAVNGIVAINEHGLIKSFNPSAERLFGWSAQEVIGRNVSMLMSEPFASQHDGYIHRYLDTHQAKIIGIGREIVAKRKDDTTFPAHLSVGHAQLANGQHLFIGFVADISAQKQNEEELRKAKEEAEAAVKAKATFLANMSHEIRTPMNAILGFADVVLKDKQLSSEAHKHVKTIHRSAKSLLTILNDVLDVSKLESGKFSLEVVCFNLLDVLLDAKQTIEQRAQEKSLLLEIECSPELPNYFLGDPTRLRQVLLNLLSNAVKFTEKGQITVSVSLADDEEMLHFSVKDTGIGMTPAQVAKVFDAFTQADGTTTRRFGGTGLGTTISKQIVETMGGRIWVESELGKGSEFHFVIRLPRGNESMLPINSMLDERADQYQSAQKLNVLLAEDIEENAMLISFYFKEQGHQLHWAQNGREAVDAYRAQGFDLILMDVMMPVLDGLSATKEIRAQEQSSGAHIPIVALTASAMREDYLNCVNAGMDRVLTKPLDYDLLFRTMDELVPHAVLAETIHPADSKGGEAIDFSALDGVVDYVKALRIWRSPELFMRGLGIFAAEHAHDAKKIAVLPLEQKDDLRAQMIAHALKGVAGNMAMIQVEKLAGQINTALKQADRNTTLALLPELEQALQSTVAGIRRFHAARQALNPHPPIHYDAAAVQLILVSLLKALEELNPDVIEPKLQALESYIEEAELAPFYRALYNFDFDAVQLKTHALAMKLGLILE